MSDRFERAKSERNLLERLMAKIPGFAGFQERELRRDVDKLEREHLSAAVLAAKDTLRGKARAFADAGKIAALGGFDRLEKKLDGFSQAIRFADYGATGFFDPVKIDEADLARLYDFDLAFVAEVESLSAAIASLPSADGDDPKPSLDAITEHLARLEKAWRERENVVAGVTGA